MAGDEDAASEGSVEPIAQDERWQQLREQLRQISPRFAMWDIVAQLAALTRRRAKPRGLVESPHEPLGDHLRAAARQLAELARQDGDTDLADKLEVAGTSGRDRGRPSADDTHQLFLDYCDVVEVQATPHVKASTEILAGREPWRGLGYTPAQIKGRLTRYLDQEDKDAAWGLLSRKKLNITLAEFTKGIWQTGRMEYGDTDLAGNLKAARTSGRDRGRPSASDTSQLLLDYCDVVEVQAAPHVEAATEILAGQEPWRGLGYTPDAIKRRLTLYLRQEDKDEAWGLLRREPLNITLAEFTEDIWQAGRAE